MASRTFSYLRRMGTKVLGSSSSPARNLARSFSVSGINNSSTYKAAVLKEFGNDLEIIEMARKKLAPNEVSRHAILLSKLFRILTKMF